MIVMIAGEKNISACACRPSPVAKPRLAIRGTMCRSYIPSYTLLPILPRVNENDVTYTGPVRTLLMLSSHNQFPILLSERIKTEKTPGGYRRR